MLLKLRAAQARSANRALPRARLQEGFRTTLTVAHHVGRPITASDPLCVQTDGATSLRGLDRINQRFVLTMAAYNLTLMRGLAQVRQQGAQ